MSIIKNHKASPVKGLEEMGGVHDTQQSQAGVDKKSAQKVHKGTASLAKTDARYWQRPGKLVMVGGSPNYSLQVAYKGRRMRFTTHTGNKGSAAVCAAGIYKDLLTLGVEATLAKHRTQTPTKGDKVATVGEWITSARTVSEVNDSTFNQYSASLRKIAGDIMAIKRSKSRFGPKTGGAAKYRAAIDDMGLDALTPVAIQQWRMSYVKKAKNPKQESSAKTSCNSTIRQAKSLFAPKVVKFMKELRLPEPAPFAGVEFYERQNSRYSSRIDIADIGTAARTQLAKQDPQAFLAFLLAIGAGLRRGEIDSLCWHQVDTKKCLIRVEVTESASLKTTDSVGEVDIDQDTATLLQGYRALAKAKDRDYVIVAEGRKKQSRGPRAWGQHYRANAVFDALVTWLRNYEQDKQKPLAKVRKPIHELRKELGALMAQQHGIYAASRALRHSNVATTAAHYADKKARTTVAIGSFIAPENVVEMPASAPEPAPEKVNKSESLKVSKIGHPKKRASR